jgi:hypothetical protein
MDEWALAADRHGIAATADLRRAALGAGQIESLVAARELTPLARGWYAVGVPNGPEDRHILTTRALLRARPGQLVASHHSALLILGLPTYRADLSRVRLARRTPGPTRTRAGYSVGRAVPASAQLADTVSPALAVVQHGLSSGPLSALVAADAALHQRLATREDLSSALDWIRFHPRSAGVKRFVALADGRRESPGETRLAHAFHLMGVAVTPQAHITAPGFSAYVDFALDGENIVVEFDGKVKYGRSSDDPDPFGNRRTPQQVLWAKSAGRTSCASWVMRWSGSPGMTSRTSLPCRGVSARRSAGPAPVGSAPSRLDDRDLDSPTERSTHRGG